MKDSDAQSSFMHHGNEGSICLGWCDSTWYPFMAQHLCLRPPQGAVRVETLKMYQPLPAKGVYFCLHPNGDLAAVGVGDYPVAHGVDTSSQGVCCARLLSIEPGGRAGRFQDGMSLTVFREDGTIIERSAYSDGETLRRDRSLTFATWARWQFEF